MAEYLHPGVYVTEIALSAKNAVILSSPLTLPDGRYTDTFTLTLLLNPRETQQ